MAAITKLPYRIRPGRLSDVGSAARLYAVTFDKDDLLDVIFPRRRQHRPDDVVDYVYRLFLDRYWGPEWVFDILVVPGPDGKDLAAGVTWWKRPQLDITFYQRWISPSTWIRSLVNAYISIVSKLRPLPGASSSNDAMGAFGRVMKSIEPSILTTPRRRAAWYLSTLIIDPVYQGQGFGGALLQHGIDQAQRLGRGPRNDKEAVAASTSTSSPAPTYAKGQSTPIGTACWLVGVYGSERFYSRFGYIEVARANIGGLSAWNGGAVMLRE